VSKYVSVSVCRSVCSGRACSSFRLRRNSYWRNDVSTRVYPENIGEILELFRSGEIPELRRNPAYGKIPVAQGKLGKIRNFASCRERLPQASLERTDDTWCVASSSDEAFGVRSRRAAYRARCLARHGPGNRSIYFLFEWEAKKSLIHTQDESLSVRIAKKKNGSPKRSIQNRISEKNEESNHCSL